MLLDKPDITWNSEDAQDFFAQMNKLFELEDRYQAVKNKTEILIDITEILTNLTHAKRATYLEWLIIVLIAFEIIISLVNKFI